ncbi:hypothetical protein ANN_05218 [Periplaneta americana]|uniref:Uncharacterized protein n=1 Tax=Periplaneta americana TaxID=6978 RepID=A0ABQ8TAH9_PERAM|nr:hypothetical protein ANN_05218 [Periplaneta americana]
MSPGSSTESYPAFVHIGLRENPGRNLNQEPMEGKDRLLVQRSHVSTEVNDQPTSTREHLKSLVYETPIESKEAFVVRRLAAPTFYSTCLESLNVHDTQ